MKLSLTLGLLFLTLISINLSQSPLRTIYDEYNFDPLLNKWEGYAYYLNPSMSIDNEIKLYKIKLDSTGLYIEDFNFLDSICFLFSCDNEENLPCSLNQFKKIYEKYYPKFIQDAQKIIEIKKIKDVAEQCMIVQILDNKIFSPHLICLYINGQGRNLKSSIKRTNLERIKEAPLDSIVNNIQTGESFEVIYTFDNFFSYLARLYVRELEFELKEEDNKTMIIHYTGISSHSKNCQVDYRNIKLPSHITQKDSGCCIQFDYESQGWTMCSQKLSDCITPIRRLASFMVNSCTRIWKTNPKSITPNYNSFVDNREKGFWSGWGYFMYVPGSDIKNCSTPKYIKVGEDFIKIQNSEQDSVVENSIETISLKWICGHKIICTPKNYTFFSYNPDTVELVTNDIIQFMVENKLKEKNCGVFQDSSNKEFMLCIYDEKQIEGFQNALINDYEKKLIGLSSLSPIPDNSILNLLVSDGKQIFIEPIQFGVDEIKRFNTPNFFPLLVYYKVGSINGEICQVLIHELNIPNEILNRTIDNQPIKGHCCLATQYNGLLYICAVGPKCEKIIIRIAKKINSRCEKNRNVNNLENDHEIDYNKQIINKHEKGFWSGYVKYSKLGVPTPKKPMYVEINPDDGYISIRAYANSPEKLQFYKILNLEWICQSELPCGVEEYLSRKYSESLKRQFDRLFMELNLQKNLQCVALEVREKVYFFSQKSVALFCPYDRSGTQGLDFKLAIKNAYDKLIEKADINELPFAPEGSEYKISIFNVNYPEKLPITTKVLLLPNYLQKIPEQTPLLYYSEMKELGNVKCGLEFRNLTLPKQLKDTSINPQCCFSLMKNKDKLFICSQSEIRCITHSRMMMKRIKLDCMTLLSVEAEISNHELEDIAEQVDIVHRPDPSLKVLGPPNSNDKELKFDLLENVWQGNVQYGLIENNENIKIKKGFVRIEDDLIKVYNSSSEITTDNLNHSIYSLRFACNSPDLCHPSNYITHRQKTDSIYQQTVLNNALKSFGLNIDAVETNCLIIEFENPFFHYITSYIVCTEDNKQGFFLRHILSCRYEQMMNKFKIENESYIEKLKEIPDISVKDRFPLKFYQENSDEVSSFLVEFLEDSIQSESTFLTFLKYDEIENCGLNSDVSNEKINRSLIHDKTNINCCLQIKRFGKDMVICAVDNFRCIRSKIMIIKHIEKKCKKMKKILRTPIFFDLKKPIYIDEFRFQIPRKGLSITSDNDLSIYKNSFINNCENGVWKGWVYAATLTERNINSQIQSYYLDLTKETLRYKTNHTGKTVFYKKTKYYKWICNSYNPCTPTEYLKEYTQRASWRSVMELKKSILNLIHQLPNEDDKSCMIVEFEHPKTRTRSSELLCTLFPEDSDSLKEAFDNAYYFSLSKADVMNDLPTASYLTESFTVRIWEEKRVIEDVITFNEIGLTRNSTEDEKERQVLYPYSVIAKDKQGTLCAFWFKNLKLPKELQDSDPNCCFTFNLKNGKNVYICSNDPYRCIKKAKITLQKLKLGCLAKNRDHLPSPYENENTVSPLQPLDHYFKVLYDDSTNGFWRGLVFQKKLGEYKTISSNPNYMRIENGYISFYTNEKITLPEGGSVTPLEKLVIRNMFFTCDTDYTCDIKNFIQYYKEKFSDESFDLDKLREDINEVTNKLPKNSDEDKCCTVISFKDENQIKTNYLICTRVAEQGEKIKQALTISLNNIIMSSNIQREIPMAKLEDVFDVQFYDPERDIVQNLEISFGKHFVSNFKTGEKILKYTDLRPDKYGYECAIWYKQLILPDQITANSYCCFMYNKNDMSYIICSTGTHHCIKRSRIMIKTVYEGCKAKEKGVNLDGYHSTVDIPEIRNPNTEVLGEQKLDLNTDKPENKTVFTFIHQPNENLVANNYEKGIFKTWMIEFILPNSPVEALSPREIYFVINERNILIYEDVNQKLIESFELKNLNWVCYKEFSCLPSELLNYYRYLNDVNVEYKLLDIAYTTVKDSFPDDKQCFGIDVQNNDDPTIKRIFCLFVYQEDIYNFLQKALSVAYHISIRNQKYFDIKMPTEYRDKFYIEYIAPGQTNIQTLNINFGEKGMEYEKDTFMLYQSPDSCSYCYEIIESIELLRSPKSCCLKFEINRQNGFICDQDAFRCDRNIRQITKYLFEKCSNLNKMNEVTEPGFCIVNQSEPLKFWKNNPKNDDFNIGTKLENLAKVNALEYSKTNSYKKKIEDNLLRLNNEIKNLNKIIVVSKKIDDITYNVNEDGSKTTIKTDGTQIIEEKDQTKAIIKNDNSLEIQYPDGTNYLIKNEGENIMSLPDQKQIIISNGNYKLKQSKEIDFLLNSDGSSNLFDNGDNTFIDQNESCITILKDGTKITKRKDGFTEIDINGTISIVKSPEIMEFKFKETKSNFSTKFLLFNLFLRLEYKYAREFFQRIKKKKKIKIIIK